MKTRKGLSPAPNAHAIALDLTHHALEQLCRRRLSESAIGLVMHYGRRVYCRGARIFVVGRNEIRRFHHQGVDLRHLEGIHVVCSPEGSILTAYRNRGLAGVKRAR